jgi:hypothetical protein
MMAAVRLMPVPAAEAVAQPETAPPTQGREQAVLDPLTVLAACADAVAMLVDAGADRERWRQAAIDAWEHPGWVKAAEEYHAEQKREPHRAAKPLLDRDYVLTELRCLSLRARIIQADIDAIGLALKNGLISPAQAMDLIVDEVEPAFDELPA